MIIFFRKCIRLCVLYVVLILCVGIYFGGFSGNYVYFLMIRKFVVNYLVIMLFYNVI